MHAKSNRITYRFNEQEQQLLEINPKHTKKGIEEGLKRAFTIMPLQVHQSMSDVPVKPHEQLEQSKNEWPNIEELEALIRGDASYAYVNSIDANSKDINRTFNNLTVDDTEQLELPLKFTEKNMMHHDSNSIEFKELAPPIPSPTRAYTHVGPGADVEEETAPQVNELSVAWNKVATALFSSIVTGVLIGYVLLLAVYGVKVWPINMIQFETIKQVDVQTNVIVDKVNTGPNGVDQVTNGPPVPQVSENTLLENEPAVDGGIVVNDNENKSTIVIQPMQSFTYMVLQAGVFTKEDTKQALIDRLHAGGYPATSINTYDGKKIVFAGIASSLQSTFQINHMKDIELYRKTFSVHTPKLSEDAKIDEQLQQWVYNAHDLMQSSMQMSEAQFEQTSLSAINKNSYQFLIEKNNAFTKETEQLIQTVGDEELVLHLQWHLDQFKLLHEQWNTYQGKPSLAPLFNIQNYLLSIVSYQIQWFEN